MRIFSILSRSAGSMCTVRITLIKLLLYFVWLACNFVRNLVDSLTSIDVAYCCRFSVEVYCGDLCFVGFQVWLFFDLK